MPHGVRGQPYAQEDDAVAPELPICKDQGGPARTIGELEDGLLHEP